MSNIIENKRGTDQILSIYWFTILTIIAGGIIIMVYLFYGPPIDIRDYETDLLIDHISNCLSQGGYLKQGVITPDETVFKENCNLNFNAEIVFEPKGEQYYSKISFLDVNGDVINNKQYSNIEIGNKNYLGSCELQINNPDTKFESSPECKEKRFYVVNKATNQGVIVNILVAINKIEKNIKD